MRMAKYAQELWTALLAVTEKTSADVQSSSPAAWLTVWLVRVCAGTCTVQGSWAHYFHVHPFSNTLVHKRPTPLVQSEAVPNKVILGIHMRRHGGYCFGQPTSLNVCECSLVHAKGRT